MTPKPRIVSPPDAAYAALDDFPTTSAAADWSRWRGRVRAAMQSVAGPVPGPERCCPLDVEVLEEVELPAFTRRLITFASEPGDRVPAYLLLPKQPRSQPGPAVLALHQTTLKAKQEPAGVAGSADLPYGAELAERGYTVLCPDYCLPKSVAPEFDAYVVDPYGMGYLSMTMKGIWNHMRALDLLQATPGVDGDRIAAIGHSLGGHNSIFLAVFDDRVKAVVSSCGFTSFEHYYGGNIKGWSHAGYMPRIADHYDTNWRKLPFDFSHLIASLAPRGFYTNSPQHDANFDLGGVRHCLDFAAQAYAVQGAPERLQSSSPDCGHSFPRQQRQEAYQFLDTWV